MSNGNFKISLKHKRIIIILVVLVVICSFAVIISPPQIVTGDIKIDTSIGMTSKQRQQDFNNLCKFLKKNVPFINEYQDLYGVSFNDIKTYYANLVENADSDYEYYTYVEGFLNNIPSGHMNIGYPNVDIINGLYQYRINDYPKFANASTYWENQLRTESKKYYNNDVRFNTFFYVDGEYLQSEYYANINKNNYTDMKLVAIDNVPIDEFIKICPLEYKLQYDHINQKPYRSTFILNNTCGIGCTAEYQTANGKIYLEKSYYGTVGTDALKYKDYFNAADDSIDDTNDTPEQISQIDYSAQEILNNNIYSFNSSDDKFIYVMFNDFIKGGTEFIKLLDNADIPDNIIIDLRYNTGGYSDIPIAIIEKLITKEIEINEVLYRTDFGEITDLTLCDGRLMYKQTENINIHGKSQKEYNIYVLVSGYTLSAADNFAALIKNNNLGIIIGDNNTGGEAYGSPDLNVLEISGLYFYYTNIKWLNEDGTDNSVYGTSPDIYISFDSEQMKKRDKLILNSKPVYTYENRLKWDDVLIETLEIIKEKENAE
jgi:hypothetical protein